MNLLSDIRVLELATGIAGPYCGKLFADAGADVIKVEPSSGDPLRRRAVHGERLGDRDAALFRFLNEGKRSVVGDPEDAEIVALVGGADLVIESFVPARLDVEALRRRFPALVIASVTPYGRGGSWEERPSTEFTVQAESGGTGGRGDLERPPLQAGGRLSEWVTGPFAAVGALAAISRALRTGRGETVDVSQLEATTRTFTLFNNLKIPLLGMQVTGHARHTERPSVEPTLDGYVGFNTNTRRMVEDFLVLIERPDLIGDDRYATLAARNERPEEWDEIVRTWTRTKTTEEIVELAGLFRIPVAPVMDARGVLEHPQFEARGCFGESPDGDFVRPLPPYAIDGARPTPRDRAPRLGEHSGSIEERPPHPAPPEPEAARSLPLAGVRVLDATSWWAGPSSTQLLAFLGADVIHLESATHPDGARTSGISAEADEWWEMASLYVACNTNKRGVTLALDSPRGLELVRRLIRTCDAVVENFSPRVFDQFGLTWEAIHALNPRTVLVRMPGFGTTGPWRDNIGFAQTMEQISGMAWVTGYADGPPRIPLGPCDPNAGTHAAFALLVALCERTRTGLGSYVEATMVEAALNAAAEQTIAYSAYGAILTREGNRGPDAAPQGIYACRGEEEWLALAVADDEQWRALVQVLERPDWAMSATLDSEAGRREAHDLLDERLADWAALRDVGDAVDRLLRAGIPASRVADPRTIETHPCHVERGWFEPVDHPYAGSLSVPGPPFRFGGVETWARVRAPMLGEHNREILEELGLRDEEIAELEATGVAGRTLARA
jgi:crotonobetainyl-CoA:carnitine CoA-transferase CaiB-like acyl-CoA transferase